MGAKKIPGRLHAVGNPDYQRLVGWAADQTSMSRSQAFDFIDNLITAYDALVEARKYTNGVDDLELIHQAPKWVM